MHDGRWGVCWHPGSGRQGGIPGRDVAAATTRHYRLAARTGKPTTVVRYALLMERCVRPGPVFVWVVVAAGCGFPRPSPVGGADDGNDGMPASVCTANQSLRCDGGNLVRCNSDGTAEVTSACSLGCSAAPFHCNDIDP